MYKKERITVIGVKNNNNRQYIEALESEGYQVDSLIVLNKEKQSNTPFMEKARLIIVDMSQCFQFHFELSGAVQEQIPMIALFDKLDEYESRESLYTKGVVDCISPPFIATELLFKVKTILHYAKCVCLFKSDFTAFLNHSNQTNSIDSIKYSDKHLVHETCQYLQKRIDQKLNLDDVAISMGANRSKLASLFKIVLGVGVFEWLREQRMLKAKSLLECSELSIQEIGFEVGFENCANFSTAYKKHFQISPRQQRNQSK